MKIKDITEGLDSNQRRVGQVGGAESAKSIGPVLGKKPKQHPFKGRLVGEDKVQEVAPPGMEDWIRDRKAEFKKRYGDRWQEVLYATAWKRKKNESVAESQLDEVVGYNQGGGAALARKTPPKKTPAVQTPAKKKDTRSELQRMKDAGRKNWFAIESDDEKIGDRYDSDEWDEKMQRLKKLAGAGPLKTVWDPVKRVYKNVPVNQKPEEK